MALVGVGGAARAGKDAFADVLVRDFGFTRMGMSDVLRDALVALDPCIVSAPSVITLPDGSQLNVRGSIRVSRLIELVGYTEAKRVPEVRRLLQALGTEVGRGLLGEDIWVGAMRRRIIEQFRGDIASGVDTNVVVTGIRFENELEMIEALAGRSVYIHRSEALQVALSSLRHASELALLPKDFDEIIDNNGSLEGLEAAARELARSLGVSPVSESSATLPNHRFEQTFEHISGNERNVQ